MQAETHTPKKLLTALEASQYLGIQSQTLAVWRCRGRHPHLRFHKIGRLVRYSVADLQKWIESQRKRG